MTGFGGTVPLLEFRFSFLDQRAYEEVVVRSFIPAEAAWNGYKGMLKMAKRKEKNTGRALSLLLSFSLFVIASSRILAFSSLSLTSPSYTPEIYLSISISISIQLPFLVAFLMYLPILGVART